MAEAIEIHKQLIDEFGGSHGLRDRGRLEAAIFRPQIGYYNDIVEEAAALMEAVANNHAFVDGNKRASFAITDTFLRLNGFYLEIQAIAAHNFITEKIERGEFRFAGIRDWLRSHILPLPKD
ncbi:MAG: type II toxin-antitoxin system death-on-curing family toxin [Terriglobia bacterium]